MKETERQWLAGLLEGEGCFSIRKSPNGKHKYPRVSIQMTDRDVVERAAKLMGGTAYRSDRHVKHGWKTVWIADLRRTPECKRLMRDVRYLMGERRRARIDTILEETA